jgi:putative PIN family toxin of toxin-antitoxin system
MSESEPIPVVYDCMILLQAAARPSRVHTTIRLVEEQRVILCISGPVLAEVRDVLTRPEVIAKFPALTAERVDMFLTDLIARAKMWDHVPIAFSLPRDKKDEPYINFAIEANARFLVTWNERHLTYLMRRDTPESVDFCTRYPNLRILSPVEFIAAVGR